MKGASFKVILWKKFKALKLKVDNLHFLECWSNIVFCNDIGKSVSKYIKDTVDSLKENREISMWGRSEYKQKYLWSQKRLSKILNGETIIRRLTAQNRFQNTYRNKHCKIKGIAIYEIVPSFSWLNYFIDDLPRNVI